MAVVAIDLGTTFSRVAVWRNNKVEVIPNGLGNRRTPSYVGFSKHERLIGEAAKSQASINTLNTVFGVKRLIGQRFHDIGVKVAMRNLPYDVVNNKGKPSISVVYRGRIRLFAPEEISAMIIFKMKELAENYLGTTVRKAVITVPAYFNDHQRQATHFAGSIAELDVIRIINDPTAAALGYKLLKMWSRDRSILVYDLGGGTLTVSIVLVGSGSVYEVKATSGNLRLGGVDFDNRLVEYFVQDFQNKNSGMELKNPRCLTRLRIVAEKVKHRLSFAKEAPVLVESLFNGINYTSSVSRTMFEQLCLDLFTDTLKAVNSVLRTAHMSKRDVNDVVLVGGSTRIPKIRALLSDFFHGKSLAKTYNPDETIVSGAAFYAAILSGSNNDVTQNVLLIDVVPLSLGVETCGGMMLKVIERNTPIPCSQIKELTTKQDHQTSMTIEVFEGERALTRDNHLLGVFQLDGIPTALRGEAKIMVKFDVDSNGILTVTAFDKSTGNSESISIKNRNELTKEEVKKMLSDAKEFREEDLENKERLEVRNQLESFIYDVKRSVAENLINLNVGEVLRMFQECEESLAWIEENEDCLREDYELKMSQLLLRWSPTLQTINAHRTKSRTRNLEQLKIKQRRNE